MDFPSNLKYTKDHEWVLVQNGVATMGITEFAQSELGDLVFVELPPVGKTVSQKSTLCVVESTKAASDVYAPIGGTVSEVNSSLKDKPELINTKPYSEGWMVKMTGITESDLGTLLSAEDYKKLVA